MGLRVYWEDTDAAGIVYYANYLRYFERGRSELVRARGIDQQRLLRQDGLMFAVRRVAVDYLAPARLDDELQVETCLTHLGAATLDLAQSVRRQARTLAQGQVRLACIDRAGRSRRIPVGLRACLSATDMTAKDR
ncbi:MAG: tol-pal system-associated acyl-CoA thioesterase [Alphaproteobacteria bacterium]|nr:tol-pal system-associated acyl-CoA thioesterase [Alphaproteobacteria bacterium]